LKEKKKSFLKKANSSEEKDPEFEQAYKDFKEFCDEEQDILDDIKAAEDSTALIQIKKKFIDFTNRPKKNNSPVVIATIPTPVKIPITPTVTPKQESSLQITELNPSSELKIPIKEEHANELQKKVLNFVKQVNLK